MCVIIKEYPRTILHRAYLAIFDTNIPGVYTPGFNCVTIAYSRLEYARIFMPLRSVESVEFRADQRHDNCTC